MLHFIPNSIDEGNFVRHEILVRQCADQLVYLSVTRHSVNTRPFPYFILSLTKCIVELLSELLSFFKRRKMSLAPVISLVFKHYAALFTADHFHLEPCSFDFCFVNQRCFLIRCQNRAFALRLVLELLKLSLN